MPVLAQLAIATLPDQHPPLHLIATEEQRLEYLRQPKCTSTNLRVLMAEVEFLRTLVWTLVDEAIPWKNDSLQINLMHRDAKNAALRIHNAKTRILALKKGKATWKA